MAKKHEIKQQLGAATDQLVAMSEKTIEEGFDQDVFDALDARIVDLRKQLERAEKAEKLAADLAQPVAGQQALTQQSVDKLQTARASVAAEPRVLHTRLRAFKDRTAEDGTLLRAEDEAYATGMWIKAALFKHERAEAWCRDHGMALTKAQSEGVDSAGGFLVPEQMMASIITLREQYGVFRQEATIVPMGRDTVNWPRRSGGLTAYFVGENQVLTESAASWDNVNLTAKKIGVLTRFSTELDEDAVISIADWLTNEIAYAYSVKEDDCGFNGDGTSTYGGIRGLTVWGIDSTVAGSKFTASVAVFSTLTMTDITGMMAKLPRYALPNAKFYMSQVAFATTFERLIASAGGNRIGTLDGSIAYRFLGFPIVISQKMPLVQSTLTGAVMMAFGDLRLAAAMGERRQVTIKRSDERYFDSDQVGLLSTERVDINLHDLGNATTAGPLVFMVGA